jgi:hypothetical protein
MSSARGPLQVIGVVASIATLTVVLYVTRHREPNRAGQVVKESPLPVQNGVGIFSARPNPKVPMPGLPRSHVVDDDEDLARVFALVEQEAVRAGVTPAFAEGITTMLFGALEGEKSVRVYPVGMYYFIVREAALGHDKASAARSLLDRHLDQGVVRLSSLPAREPGL